MIANGIDVEASGPFPGGRTMGTGRMALPLADCSVAYASKLS